MKYFKVKWLHFFPDDPVCIYVELDKKRFETRKVEEFTDKTYEFVNQDKKVGDRGTILVSNHPWPDNSEINSNSEFILTEITKKEFENLYLKVKND